MIGLSGLLPPIEGARLRAELETIADRTYRAKHPERAEQHGGHHEEPLAARLADALTSLTGTDESDGQSPGPSSPCRTAVVMTLSLNEHKHDHGGPTVVWNLTLLCDPHHHFLHNNHLYIDRQPGQPTLIRRQTDGTLYAGP